MLLTMKSVMKDGKNVPTEDLVSQMTDNDLAAAGTVLTFFPTITCFDANLNNFGIGLPPSNA